MRIERSEAIPYALPFREPYVTARGRLERRELILFRLTSADGVVGLGETTSLSLRGGRALGDILGELDEIGGRLVALPDRDPNAPGEPALAESIAIEAFSPEARCACTMALADLAARASGRSLADPAEAVPCNATLSSAPGPALTRAVLGWAEAGFRTFKLKVGGEGADDVEQVRAVRSAVGPEASIRIDANGSWSAGRAIETLEAMAPFGLELCEQPVASLEEMAKVREATSVPIAADESVATPADARRAIEIGACDLATLKLAKVGGPGAAAAGGWGLPVYLSSALEGPVGIAMAGATAAALRSRGGDAGIAHGLATQLLFSETIAARGPEVREGALHLPGGPGLGVEIDEAALARLRLPARG